MSFVYLQSADAGPSSFVLDAYATSPLCLRIVEPFESSPDLAGVVFTRGEDGVAGVVERAGEELVVVTGESLEADAGVGFI